MRKAANKISLLLGAVGLLLAVNQTFLFTRQVGFVINSQTFLYYLVAAFLPIVFLQRKGPDGQPLDPRLIDLTLAVLSFGCAAFLIANADQIIYASWQFSAPMSAWIVAIVLWLVVIEAARRTNGPALTLVVAIVSLYPLVAEWAPGPFNSWSMSMPELASFHVFGLESMFGVPMNAFASIVIGFIVFGLTLQHTGATRFFNDVAFALMGRVRGGAAHVAVISSGMQASISGSVISNVMTSGSVTIPAMKRLGFPGAYAGGVEAVASTGGVLTPPVMGTVAFIMATFLNLPYSEIVFAAAVPAFLFYFGLLLQVDAYAARRNLKGLPDDQLPTLGQAFREGWHYCIVFAALIWMLASGFNESRAAFYATGLLLVVNQYKPANRLSLRGLIALIASVGQGLAEILAVILAIGMIAGGLAATGILSTLSTDLVFLAGDTPFLLLMMGALTAFVLGMGMTVSACYIFLAIVLVPALTKVGFNALAVHMFVMYWGMLSFVTPPVAIATFAASAIAKVPAANIGWHSMRLASVMYFIPFYFVYNPALILQGGWELIAISIVTAMIGVAAIAWSLQGYVLGVGGIADGVTGYALRGLLMLAGLILAAPGIPSLGLNQIEMAGIGVACILAVIAIMKCAPVTMMQRL